MSAGEWRPTGRPWGALREMFRRHSLLREAIEQWRATRHSDRPHVEEQLAQVEAEIARSEQAIEHYLLAFEARTMPESLCAPRLEELAKAIANLRCRKGQLDARLDDEPDDPYDELDLGDLENLAADILSGDHDADLPATKALFQQLIDGVEVDGRTAIRPTFRVPSLVPAVRMPAGLVGPVGIEPTTEGL